MNKAHTILIVDDILANRTILADILKDDYSIQMAKNGEQALKRASSEYPPDLILLDILMPEMDGYEVCRKLKENPVTAEIPVIFVTAMDDVQNEALGFDCGAVDYITKPFRAPIVEARVKTHIKLRDALTELKKMYTMALDANPRTGLPGNNSIMEMVEKALGEAEPMTLIYSDLDDFKPFNDKYGFAHGDTVIMFTADVLKRSSTSILGPGTFIGHIGGDDFVLIVPSGRAQSVSDKIINEFDKGIVEYYEDEDRENGFIESVDRQGNVRNFPFISISLAAVDLDDYEAHEYFIINDILVDLKKKAKSIPGSVVYFDQRLR